MQSSIRLLTALVAFGSALPAWATEQGQPVASPAVATAVTPAIPAAEAAPATQPADAPVAKPAEVAAAPVTRVPAGYKSKQINGETNFCRKSTPLGSRFATEVCMTVAQYEESVRQADGLRVELTGKQKSYSNNP